MKPNDLFKVIQNEYGDDVIVIFKPTDLGYRIMQSSLSPIEQKEVLEDLLSRMTTLRRIEGQ